VINAHLAAESLVDGERWPVFVWTIDHPAGLVLVDTGMIDSRPEGTSPVGHGPPPAHPCQAATSTQALNRRRSRLRNGRPM
jgi:hypothetical protein